MTTLRRELKTALAIVLVTAGAASAQQAPQPQPQPQQECPSDAIPADCPNAPQPPAEPPPPPVVETQPQQPPPTVVTVEEPSRANILGLSVTLGGGVDDFASSVLDDVTDIGGSWNVRATYGTNSYFAVEGSY